MKPRTRMHSPRMADTVAHYLASTSRQNEKCHRTGAVTFLYTSYLAKQRLGVGITLWRNRLKLAHCLFERNKIDVLAMQSDTHTGLALVSGTSGVHAVTGSQNAVVGSRRTATLDVAKNGGTNVVARTLLDFIADDLANTVEGLVTELVYPAFLELHGAFLRQRTLSHADDSVLLAHLEAALHSFGDLSDVEWNLWDNRVMSATSHAGMQCDPTHVTAHDLDDKDTVMGLSSGVQAVDSVSSHGYCGIETKGVVRSVNVVINGLRNADNRDSVVGQPLGALERSLATDGDQCVNTRIRHVGLDGVQPSLELVWVQATRAEDGTASQEDTVDLGIVVKIATAVLHEAYPSVLVAHDGGAKFVGSGANDRADNSIQSGAVAAGGKYSKAHILQLTPDGPRPHRAGCL